jgi:tetraacyldisaccharide 4'-kinase
MSKKSFQIQDIILYPFSFIYGIGVWVRNRLFDYNILKSVEFKLPVISVGNITVGGTGKTPHIEYLISLLKDEFKVAFLSRGYKRKTIGFKLADINSSSEEIGDEPRQIKQKFRDIIVAVDGSRVRGINKILEYNNQTKVILLDDAFQHRYVTPGLSILLVEYNHPLKDDRILPAGSLREPASERHRADIIIITKCPSDLKPIDQRLIEKDLKQHAYQKVYFSTLDYGQPKTVFEGSAPQISKEEMKKRSPDILLITGIANALPFKAHIKNISSKIEELDYPDHYAYTPRDMHNFIEKFSTIDNPYKYIITTEKDAMRIQAFDELDEEIKSALYYIPIQIEFLENEIKNFNHQIQSYVRNNNPDSILYKEQNKK